LFIIVLPLPHVRGDVVEITLYGRDLPTPGWSLTPGNEADPGPTIQVNLGDEIRLRLIAEDGLPHVFYIDYNGNGLPTLGSEPISAEFTTETTLNFTADQAGFFTYWCAVHQPDMSGGWITNDSDEDSPSITGILVSPRVARPGEFVSIGATITDSSGVASAWIVVAGPDVILNITLVQFGDQWFLNRSWEAVGTYEFVIGAQDVVGNVNTASGSFSIEESLAGTFGLLVLLGTPLAVGVGVLVYLWIRRRPIGKEDEASE
ncbi:MAG: hypothetical protein V3R48_04005, partial [Thermoplasmata archaeon]